MPKFNAWKAPLNTRTCVAPSLFERGAVKYTGCCTGPGYAIGVCGKGGGSPRPSPTFELDVIEASGYSAGYVANALARLTIRRARVNCAPAMYRSTNSLRSAPPPRSHFHALRIQSASPACVLEGRIGTVAI